MHRITGDRDAVHSLLQDTVAFLKSASRGAAAAAGAEPTASAASAPEATQAIQVWQSALRTLEGRAPDAAQPGATAAASGDDLQRGVATPYAPRDQRIALFQAAMDEYLEQAGAPEGGSWKPQKAPEEPGAPSGGSAPSGPVAHVSEADTSAGPRPSLAPFYTRNTVGASGPGAAPADVFAQFGRLDPRWAEVVIEQAKVLARGKHPFVQHASGSDFRFDLDDEATIAIVGDWGGGNEAAQAVAAQIRALNPNHVIHLGDVYYAGTAREVEQRFLRFWPEPAAPGRSFALNSNHEMYSGGYAYFDQTLARFRQPASYFSLANAHWRFIGLDTGYDEHELHDPQADWLAAQQLDDGRKTVLLSHHQLFSAYESTDASRLRAKIAPFLSNVYAWIWGHEHLAVVYELHDGLRAICLGNGCFPYGFPSSPPSVPVKWIDQHRTSDPDYPGGHTFALLRLKGPRIDLEFIDEQGNVGFREVWT